MGALDWLLWALAGVLVVAGLSLLLIGVRGDPARDRRRCPRCWYEMTGLPTLRCPECGGAVLHERALRRTRRSWRAIRFGLLALLAAAACVFGPQLVRHGWRKPIPNIIYILAFPDAPKNLWLNELRDRIRASSLTMNERRMLVRRCAGVLQSRSDRATLIRAMETLIEIHAAHLAATPKGSSSTPTPLELEAPAVIRAICKIAQNHSSEVRYLADQAFSSWAAPLVMHDLPSVLQLLTSAETSRATPAQMIGIRALSKVAIHDELSFTFPLFMLFNAQDRSRPPVRGGDPSPSRPIAARLEDGDFELARDSRLPPDTLAFLQKVAAAADSAAACTAIYRSGLTGPNVQIKAVSIFALTAMPTPPDWLVPSLLALTRDEDPWVREEALRALTMLPFTPPIAEAFIAAFQDQSRPVRRNLVAFLERLHTAGAEFRPAISQTLTDMDDPAFVAKLIDIACTWRVEFPIIESAIVRIFESGHPDNRVSAAQAICKYRLASAALVRAIATTRIKNPTLHAVQGGGPCYPIDALSIDLDLTWNVLTAIALDPSEDELRRADAQGMLSFMISYRKLFHERINELTASSDERTRALGEYLQKATQPTP